MVTQLQIARRVGRHVSSVNKILNKQIGPRFRKDTVARELRLDFGRLKFAHGAATGGIDPR